MLLVRACERGSFRSSRRLDFVNLFGVNETKFNTLSLVSTSDEAGVKRLVVYGLSRSLMWRACVAGANAFWRRGAVCVYLHALGKIPRAFQKMQERDLTSTQVVIGHQRESCTDRGNLASIYAHFPFYRARVKLSYSVIQHCSWPRRKNT